MTDGRRHNAGPPMRSKTGGLLESVHRPNETGGIEPHIFIGKKTLQEVTDRLSMGTPLERWGDRTRVHENLDSPPSPIKIISLVGENDTWNFFDRFRWLVESCQIVDRFRIQRHGTERSIGCFHIVGQGLIHHASSVRGVLAYRCCLRGS